ncbi:PucR family transcriptional regulator [Mycolicibacterium stellerae]|uniref:PucR family transcriptional regulator n=1 Tax=Mycolicibacterium stellerae TaxID=2358193 RepID=UPI000F0BD822|nr:PucR family transcriptional regulator [Mycolicibacterium stellerae]
MTLTVAEVIGLPAIQAGQPQVLSARRWDEQIRWVHVGDIADWSTLLQGGELVLTTGAALRKSPARYLRGLADAGALGVVVELGSARSLPDAAATLADALNLALVELHREIKFVEVTEEVHRRIVAEQFEEVAFDRRVHETFTDLSMKRVSATGIVGAAARMLGEPVVLEDLAHQALAVAPGPDTTVELLEDWERRSRRASGELGGDGWLMTAVGTRGEEWGRLVVPRATADPARATKVLERAAVALAMDRMIERDRAGLHQQAQSGLIDEVLRDRISDEREIAVRANALGLRKTSRYFPVTVRVRYQLTGADPLARQRRNVTLLDAVAHAVNASGHTGLFATRSDGEVGAVIALSSNRAGGTDKTWDALGDAVKREVQRIDGVQHSVLAVGTPADLVTDATHALTDSAHVAEVALAMDAHDRQFYRASDVRLRGLISLLQNDPRVQGFAETELKALLTADRGGPLSDLIVLREYLRLAGNKAALATRLHISRPSLYKRLNAIERTLGVDLSDAESMVSLHVAMLVLETRRGADSAIAG